jgi:hypothetical protein
MCIFAWQLSPCKSVNLQSNRSKKAEACRNIEIEADFKRHLLVVLYRYMYTPLKHRPIELSLDLWSCGPLRPDFNMIFGLIFLEICGLL